MRNLQILPVPGRRARHPQTGEPVPEQGLRVPATAYWLRRLKSGDVRLASPEPLEPNEGVSNGDQL